MPRRPVPGLGRVQRRARPRVASARASARVGDAGSDELGGDLLGHLRVRPEVVGGAQERRLIGIRRADLGHDPAAEDDDRPIAGELDLLELRGVEQDGGPGFGQVAQQDVDLLLGPDVDAAGGVEAEQRRTPPATQRAMVTFCWLPPDSRRTSPPARASIWSLATAASTPRRSRLEVDRAPRAHASGRRQGDVLADGSLHQQGLGAVGRDVHEAGSDGVRRMAEGDRRAVHEQLAAARAVRAGQDVEQLVLSLALERDDAQHLAGVEVERDVVQLGARR